MDIGLYGVVVVNDECVCVGNVGMVVRVCVWFWFFLIFVGVGMVVIVYVEVLV